MTRLAAPTSLTLIVLALAGCETTRPTPPSAEIEIEVSPVPVVVRLACPVPAPGQPPPERCLISLDPVVTLRETAGVGGRVERLEVVLTDVAAGREDARLTLGRDWMLAQAGTDRIEARGRLAFQPVIRDYPVAYGAPLRRALTLSVRFVDDNGHVLDRSVRIDVTQ